MRSLVCVLFLLVSMVSVANATPKSTCTPPPASVDVVWVYNGVEHATLQCAEEAMKAVPGNEDLVRIEGKEGMITEPNVIVRYHVKPKAAILADVWWQMAAHRYGYCQQGSIWDPYGFCTSLAGAIDANRTAISSEFCDIVYNPSSQPYVWAGIVGTGQVGGVAHFIVEERQHAWDIDAGVPASGACNPHPGFSGTVLRRTYARCPTPYQSNNQASAWPHAICINTKTAVITTRIRQMCAAGEGNPCSPTTGNKIITASDLTSPSLSFGRTYNSMANFSTPGMPIGWTHAYSDRLEGALSGSTANLYLIDGSGQLEQFARVSANLYRSINVAGDVLTTSGGTALLTRAGGSAKSFDSTGRLAWVRSASGDPSTQHTLAYDSAGRLATVTDAVGRSLLFAYSAAGQISTLTAPDGSVVTYTVDAQHRLESVSYPGGAAIDYTYASATSHLITGIVDELAATYASYTYDAQGRATSSEHAGGAGRVELDYVAAGHTQVTRATGEVVDYLFDAGSTFFRVASVDGLDGDESYVRNTLGRVTSKTDRNGHVEQYEYSNLHRTAVVRAAGTPAQARVETDWHATLVKPTERRTYDASTTLMTRSSWTHNARGQVTSQTDTDPTTLATRTTTYAYCEAADVALPSSPCPILGQLKSIDGPRTDVSDITTYTYRAATDESGCATTGPCHRKGDLWKITNALGHVTETLRYDRAGRVRAAQDPNGVVTEFTYHPRGWLTSRTVKGATSGDDAVTSYTYDAAGQVTRITQPDGDYLDYDYDDAHRLIAIEDALGHRIEYTLDAAGNRTSEVTKDAGAAITRQLSRVYDQLGRLDQQLDAQNRATSFTYDANGNQTGIEDALGIATRQVYDPLDRLKTTIQDDTGLDIETGYTYDALDRLVTVTDPKGLDTDYGYDGLGNLVELDSPDTGITTYTYDAAGNRLTQTDARGVTATYTYDALNRLTHIAYPTSSLDVSFQYDQADGITGCTASFPIGRLTRSSDASGTTTYCYDRHGNVTRRSQTIGSYTSTLEYSYTAGGRVRTMTYPDGRLIRYSRNDVGEIVTIATRSPGTLPLVSLISGVESLPFGPISSITFDNGATQGFAYDANYWAEGVDGTALTLDFDLDATGNIVAANDPSPGNARSYTYDALARLTRIDDGNAALIEAFTYDGTGNRLSRQTSGGTQTYGYAPDSHQLTSIDAQTRSYDAMGSLTARGADAFVHDDRQRLAQAGDKVYGYNARGERTHKSGLVQPGGGSTLYIYDDAGRLISESYRSTTPYIMQRSYLWLDDRPVAVFAHTGAYAGQWLHIHTDHLGTPRAITLPNTTIVWRWDFTGSAFGDHAPQTDPDGDGTHFTFNLRFPGQYYDAESGLHYNYFRDYEAGTGRYIESDPAGLRGGIASYQYALSSPLFFFDSRGLSAEDVRRTFDQVRKVFPELAPRGTVSCAMLEDSGFTSNMSGNIQVPQSFCDAKCLSRDEWETLFFTLFHEGMHSTDPWWQDIWWPKSILGTSPNHEAIISREYFERYRTPKETRPRSGDPTWGEPLPPPGPDLDRLYLQFKSGSAECCG